MTRNILECDQSNYSSRIVLSHIPIEFGQTGISAVRSADPENHGHADLIYTPLATLGT